MRAREWLAFSVLGLLWGSSFMWIKIALREVGPFTLVAWRVTLGLAGMLIVLAAVRTPFPKKRRDWLSLVFLGLTNTALPFTLITVGQQTVDSAEVSILSGTVPLFTLLLAHLVGDEDRITASCLLGLGAGFLGVLILVGRGLEQQAFSGGMLGRLSVLGAMVSYAISGVVARRRLQGVPLIMQAFVPLLTASVLEWLVAWRAEAPLRLPALATTWISLLWLGLLGSCLAYLLFYFLIQRIGPTRTNMVTYLFPLVGVTLGVAFLQERFDLYLGLGGLLVLAGIAIVNAGSLSRRATRAD